MCGIAGYFAISKQASGATILSMVRSVAHRGPDDEGFALIDTEGRSVTAFAGSESHPAVRDRLPLLTGQAGVPHDLAMGHRRYAVIDVSPSGHQPMTFDGCTICFNGEIYNYVELREELARHGHRFETACDTEVLLHAYRQWGTGCFGRLNGPVAAVIYDATSGALMLARDRIGKAPLYYARINNRLWWASEIKAILSVNEAERASINSRAVADYIGYGIRDFGDQTFWSGINTFPAASWGIVGRSLAPEIHRYWDFPTKRLTTGEISLDEAAARLRETLADALAVRLRADIPIGITLSGGLDSSTLAALYAESGRPPIDSYTVRFASKKHNEERYARLVTDRFRGVIRPHTLDGDRHQLLDDIDNYVYLVEEPFHSPNLYTDFRIQQELKALGYGVMINGAGGDELLAGYEGEYFGPYLRYLFVNSTAAFLRELLLSQPIATIRRKGKFVLETLGVRLRASGSADARFLTGVAEREICFRDDFNGRMLDNFQSYKMNYWLRSGNVSFFGIPMEPRLPFLDHRVVDLGFALPPEYLIHGGWHKYVLRRAMEKSLPAEVAWRKRKMGFPFDLAGWLSVHKAKLQRAVAGSGCGFVDTERLLLHYDRLTAREPLSLWRYLSLLLWHKRVVLNEHLSMS